jgi:hypothetical protein
VIRQNQSICTVKKAKFLWGRRKSCAKMANKKPLKCLPGSNVFHYHGSARGKTDKVA